MFYYYFSILTNVLEKIQAFLRDVLSGTRDAHTGHRSSHAL